MGGADSDYTYNPGRSNAMIQSRMAEPARELQSHNASMMSNSLTHISILNQDMLGPS